MQRSLCEVQEILWLGLKLLGIKRHFITICDVVYKHAFTQLLDVEANP